MIRAGRRDDGCDIKVYGQRRCETGENKEPCERPLLEF